MRFTRQGIVEEYMVSVVDTDGDGLLDSAPLRATDLQSAWEQAVVIAFRACRGSGAVPRTISVQRSTAYKIDNEDQDEQS